MFEAYTICMLCMRRHRHLGNFRSIWPFLISQNKRLLRVNKHTNIRLHRHSVSIQSWTFLQRHTNRSEATKTKKRSRYSVQSTASEAASARRHQNRIHPSAHEGWRGGSSVCCWSSVSVSVQLSLVLLQ